MINTFAQARLKLAILYTLTFGLVILFFSGVIYHLFAADIHEDMANIYEPGSLQVEIVNKHKLPLLHDIILLDIGILLFIAAMSYYLAGLTLKPIQQNDEAQKQFIATASHELRTPVAILKADMEVYLLDKKFPDFLRPVFGGYLEEIDNMKLIIENMLTLFRFESHQMKLNREKIFIFKLVTDNVKSLETYASSKNIKLKILPTNEIQVWGDKFFLQQALRNILKNAIEYSHSAESVSISVAKVGQMVQINIQDQGIGIPKEILNQIFNRFQRSSAASQKRQEGLGLGLSLAKQIIELHDGSISLVSVEGQGTTVTMTLPIIRKN